MSAHRRHETHAAAPVSPKSCGHSRHVGWCACCQRAQLERWSAQLASARPARRVSH